MLGMEDANVNAYNRSHHCRLMRNQQQPGGSGSRILCGVFSEHAGYGNPDIECVGRLDTRVTSVSTQYLVQDK